MLTPFLRTYAISLVVILIYMTLIWIASLIKKDSSIVDIFWGLGFVVVATFNFFYVEGFVVRKVVNLILVAIWGLRLSGHILIRNWGQEEDYRYRQWREEAGEKWWWYSFFKVFLVQGLIMWLVSCPIVLAQFHDVPARLTVVDLLGVLVWGVGFFFEAVGDWQLTQFKSDPANKGKVLRSGLWRYTRHPNYFGDATVWWGHYLLAASTPGGFWTIFSPILMTYLLLNVSGVALLEKKQKETKPKYRDYVERTSAFFPLPPKRRDEDEEK